MCVCVCVRARARVSVRACVCVRPALRTLTRTYHLSPVTCHLSPVTYHLSPVTCHLSLVTLITTLILITSHIMCPKHSPLINHPRPPPPLKPTSHPHLSPSPSPHTPSPAPQPPSVRRLTVSSRAMFVCMQAATLPKSWVSCAPYTHRRARLRRASAHAWLRLGLVRAGHARLARLVRRQAGFGEGVSAQGERGRRARHAGSKEVSSD